MAEAKLATQSVFILGLEDAIEYLAQDGARDGLQIELAGNIIDTETVETHELLSRLRAHRALLAIASGDLTDFQNTSIAAPLLIDREAKAILDAMRPQRKT